MVSQRPRRQYMVLQWGQVDLQEYANGSFVSNNNIFTIPFLNTYYHKQMNKILIAAYNEAFRQSSDPVYAHTPMRNVGGLRTFNPKLKDSAGGEVNNKLVPQATVYSPSCDWLDHYVSLSLQWSQRNSPGFKSHDDNGINQELLALVIFCYVVTHQKIASTVFD